MKCYFGDIVASRKNVTENFQLSVGQIVSLDEIEILDALHSELDHTVLDAYGWPRTISDENILVNLLKLNLERAGIK